jgi:hypothetical protein
MGDVKYFICCTSSIFFTYSMVVTFVIRPAKKYDIYFADVRPVLGNMMEFAVLVW